MTTRILTGDCRETLATLDAESVQTCVTSPPYFGLRDYGHAGQIGLEPTPDAYVAELVAVFRAVRRVLRADGTLWLNLGDSYATQPGKGSNVPQTKWKANDYPGNAAHRSQDMGVAPKNLIGIPWRVAFALQADGWYLRSDIIWSKPNPMPESVTDRPTKAHEYVFLLSKSERYFYDAAAIAEPSGGWNGSAFDDGKNAAVHPNVQKRPSAPKGSFKGKTEAMAATGQNAFRAVTDTRNARSVWSIATQPYSGAHFATMPPALAERCVLAGSSPKACETCSAVWARQTETEYRHHAKWYGEKSGADGARNSRGKAGQGYNEPIARHTTGWAPTCACETNTGAGRCVVLDPFGGAGTTGLVADRLGRDAILCELNPAYAALAADRVRGDSPLFAEVSA